jgi:hypothetical protein
MHEVAWLFPNDEQRQFLSFWQNVGLDTKWYALGQGTFSDGALMGLEGVALVNVWGWTHVHAPPLLWWLFFVVVMNWWSFVP